MNRRGFLGALLASPFLPLAGKLLPKKYPVSPAGSYVGYDLLSAGIQSGKSSTIWGFDYIVFKGVPIIYENRE